MLKSETVEKAANSLSDRFSSDILYYAGVANRARLWHYLTIYLLIFLSSITPFLTSAIAVLHDPPLYLKISAVAATSGAGAVVLVRAIGNYQQQWQTFYMSKLAIIRLRRQYKFRRARLEGDTDQKLKLIEDTFLELDRYIKDESEASFISMLQSTISVEGELRKSVSL